MLQIVERWELFWNTVYMLDIGLLVDSASRVEAERPWQWRTEDLLESREPLRRCGLGDIDSPATVFDVVGRSCTVSFSGGRAIRGRTALAVWALVMLTDVAVEGFRTVSLPATTGGITRWVDANSVGPFDSLPAVEQSLMLDKLRRRTCSCVRRPYE